MAIHESLPKISPLLLPDSIRDKCRYVTVDEWPLSVIKGFEYLPNVSNGRWFDPGRGRGWKLIPEAFPYDAAFESNFSRLRSIVVDPRLIHLIEHPPVVRELVENSEEHDLEPTDLMDEMVDLGMVFVEVENLLTSARTLDEWLRREGDPTGSLTNEVLEKYRNFGNKFLELKHKINEGILDE